jgi:hypothetical protein
MGVDLLRRPVPYLVLQLVRRRNAAVVSFAGAGRRIRRRRRWVGERSRVRVQDLLPVLIKDDAYR